MISARLVTLRRVESGAVLDELKVLFHELDAFGVEDSDSVAFLQREHFRAELVEVSQTQTRGKLDVYRLLKRIAVSVDLRLRGMCVSEGERVVLRFRQNSKSKNVIRARRGVRCLLSS